MDKDEIKRILINLIDSVDEVQDFSISNDIEEISMPTLDGEWKERKPTGITNIYITTYREQK